MLCVALAKEALLTQENPMKKGIILSPRCFLCGEQAETINHLFLYCTITRQLWRMFLNLRGIGRIARSMPGKITEAITSQEKAGFLANNRGRWRIVPPSIWWTIWKERNSRCFESIENNMQHIKFNCILLLCFWCNQLLLNDHCLLLMLQTHYRHRIIDVGSIL